MPVFNVPGRGRVQLPEGLKQEEYQAILRGMQMEQAESYTPEYTFGQLAGRPIQRTFENIGTSIRKELPAMGLAAIGKDEAARGLMEEAKQEYAEREQRLPRMYQSYEDVTGPGSALGYGYERLMEAAPYGLAMLLPGGVAAAGARGIAARAGAAATEAAIARGLPSALAESAGAARAAQVTQRAALGGAGAGGYALNAPETFSKILEETGELRPGVASVAAIGQTFLDLVAPASFLNKLGGFGRAKMVEEMTKRAGFKEAAKDIGLAAAKTAPKEGLTEAAQEFVSNLAVKYVDDNYELFSPERIKEYIEAGLSGAAGGAGLGAAGRAVQRVGMPVEPVAQEPVQAQEPLQTQQQIESDVITPRGVITPQTVTDQVLTDVTSGVTPQTVEGFVEDLVAGKSVDEPQMQQFYAENAPAIEALLQQRKQEAAPEAPTGELTVQVPEAETLQITAPEAPTSEITEAAQQEAIEPGPPEFVEPPEQEGPAPVPEDVQSAQEAITKLEKEKERVEAEDRKLKAKGETLLSTIKKYGGLKNKDIENIREKDLDTNLDDLVMGGRLDSWLPSELRSVFLNADGPDTLFLQSQAIEHIKDRLRSRDYVSESTKIELERIGFELEEAIQYVREYYDELERNKALEEAAAEQRPVYEQVEPAITEGEERAAEPIEDTGPTKAAAPSKVTYTPSSYAEQMMAGTLPDTDEANAYFEANRDAIEVALTDLEERRAEPMMRGTAEQKKTAESHASDLGGLVVYLDGDLALIRGHSRLTGQPVYLVSNGGMRSRVDVDAYTGSLINAKQKAKLVAARNAIELKEEEKHAKSPFVRFDSQGVAVSQSVSPQLAGVIAGWKKLLKVTPKIYVTTISDIKTNLDKFTGPHRAIGSAALGNEYGSVRKMADGEYYIAFTDGMSMSRMLETLAHELGHMHMRETFENADVATQKAIRDEYDKWLNSNKGKSAREHIQSMRARGLGKLEKIGEKHKSEDLSPYWSFFKEWYADQVSRWATTSEKPLNVVERFFKRLADAMRSFYAKLRNQKYLPNETFKQYMDKVVASVEYVAPVRMATTPISKTDQIALFMKKPVLDPSDTEVLYMRRAADDLIDAGKDLSPEDQEKLLQDVDQLDTTPQKGMNAMDSMIKETPSFQSAKEKLGAYVNDATTNNADSLLAFLNMRQISEMAKKVLPQFAQYYRVITNMIDSREKQQTDAAKIYQRWEDWAVKHPEQSKALDQVMMDARMSGIDPTDPKKEEKMRGSFLANWNKIKGGEGEKIFVEVRDFWKSQLELKRKILENKIMIMMPDENMRQKTMTELRAEFEKFVSDGPYFPLTRFGDYFVAYNIKMADGSTKPYHEMFESQADQRNHLKAIEKDIASGKIVDLKTGVDTKEMMSQGVIKSQFLNKIFSAVDGIDQGDLYRDTKQRVKDDIYQAYLSMMPDLSVHKHFIHAKKVAGASLDFRRGFAETAFHNINHLSRLDYGYVLDQIVAEASRVAKASNNNAAGRYLKELDRLHSDFSNPQKQNPIWSKISNFSFLFYLTAPASAIVNMTQTPIIGMPTMAGKFNVSYAKVGAEIVKASKEFFASRKGMEFNLAEYLRKQGRKAEADALDNLESTLNRTQTLSLAGVAERPSFMYTRGIRSAMRAKGLTKLQKLNMGLGYMFNQAEIYNRYVTALVSIRLANEANTKSTLPKFDAEATAREMVNQIHFEYSAETKPRFMRGPFGQVALQFKNYSQQITYLLVDSFKKAYLSNSEIEALRLKSLDQGLSESDRIDAKREYDEAVDLRREARKRLTGILGMTAIFAGYEGLPLYWVVEGTMNMLFGDDDEPYDFSLEMKVAMADMFGDNASRIFSRGAMSELLQIDLASRTSLNGIWFRDDASAKDEEEWTKNMLIDLMGPAAGIVVNTGDAIKKMNEGHYARGMEAMMPPVIKDFFKAARFSTEGATTLRGDPIVPDISAYNIFMQSLGFTPTDVARGYEAMGEIKGIEKKIEQRRSRLLGKLWLAHQNGDYEAYADIGEDIIKFNASNPNEQIDAKTIKNSFAQRERTAARAERGIVVSPKREYLLEKTSYLDEE